MVITKENVINIGGLFAAAYFGKEFSWAASSTPRLFDDGEDSNIKYLSGIQFLGVTPDDNHLIYSVGSSYIGAGTGGPMSICEQYRFFETEVIDHTKEGVYQSKIGPANLSLKTVESFDVNDDSTTDGEGYLILSRIPGDLTFFNRDPNQMQSVVDTLKPIEQFNIDFNQDFKLSNDVRWNNNINDMVSQMSKDEIAMVSEFNLIDYFAFNNTTTLQYDFKAIEFELVTKLLGVPFEPYAKNRANGKSIMDLMYHGAIHTDRRYDPAFNLKSSIRNIEKQYPAKTIQDKATSLKCHLLAIDDNLTDPINNKKMDAELMKEITSNLQLDENTIFDQGKRLPHILLEPLRLSRDTLNKRSGHQIGKLLESIIAIYDLDLNAQDDNGNTPIHILAKDNILLNVDTLKWMIANNADLEIENNNGETVLDYANETYMKDSQGDQYRDATMAFIEAAEQYVNSRKAASSVSEEHLIQHRATRNRI